MAKKRKSYDDEKELRQAWGVPEVWMAEALEKRNLGKPLTEKEAQFVKEFQADEQNLIERDKALEKRNLGKPLTEKEAQFVKEFEEHEQSLRDKDEDF